MVANFWGDLYLTTPSLYMVGFTSIAMDLPEENFKNEHMPQGFLRNILYHFGVKGIGGRGDVYVFLEFLLRMQWGDFYDDASP